MSNIFCTYLPCFQYEYSQDFCGPSRFNSLWSLPGPSLSALTDVEASPAPLQVAAPTMTSSSQSSPLQATLVHILSTSADVRPSSQSWLSPSLVSRTFDSCRFPSFDCVRQLASLHIPRSWPNAYKVETCFARDYELKRPPPFHRALRF